MRNIVGKPVYGDDFVGREADLDQIQALLESDNILLLAPRRVGKTSLMAALQDRGPAKHIATLDVSGTVTEVDFVRILARAIEQSSPPDTLTGALRRRLAPYLERVESAGAFGVEVAIRSVPESEWQAAGDAVLDALAAMDTKVLILIDELPVLLLHLLQREGGELRVSQLLGWLRQARLDRRLGRVRWLLAGSVGLDTVAIRLGITASVNDLVTHRLGAFDLPAAQVLLDGLATSHRVALPHDARDYMLERVGWLLPHHVQILFYEIRTRQGDAPVTRIAVDEAWSRLLDSSHEVSFHHWRSRLDTEIGPIHAEHARAVLDICAEDPAGAPRSALAALLAARISDPNERDKLWAWLSHLLEVDGYVVAERDRLRFRSPLLRDAWLAPLRRKLQ